MEWTTLTWGAFLALFGITFVAGVFGALLGVGGGIIMVPVLTLIFHMPMAMAVGTSLISVIGTSTAAAIVYVEDRYSDVRLGMVLEIATTMGGLMGGLTAIYLSERFLQILFTVVMTYTALSMARGRPPRDAELPPTDEVPLEPAAGGSGQALGGEYYDAALGKHVRYRVRNLPGGMAGSFVAGNVSGLLGIGAGIIKVPTMHLIMGVPLKVAVGTSNLMIGITAVTSALVYYSRGLINPLVTAPAALGILLGAQVGSRLSGRIHSDRLKRVFIVLLLFVAGQMLLKALRGGH